MRLGEGKLRDEWLHVLSCFLKYRVVFTPECPPLQDAPKQSGSTAPWLRVDSLSSRLVGLFIGNKD